MSNATRNLDALDATDTYDVCVVGAGLAGSVLALRFARAGLRVLLIDARAQDDPPSSAAGAVFDYDADGDARKRPPAGSGLLAARMSSRRVGAFERLERADFRMHPYNRHAPPWPLCYPDLEPHYRAAESMLRVRQNGPRAGRRVPAADERPADRAFGTFLRGYGMDVTDVATATPGRGRARFDAAAELLPEIDASRTGARVAGAVATRLRADGNGRIIGALCRGRDGATKTARAHAYVVAAGALETPRLLLLSRSQRFPHGIGNDYGGVGRGLHDQAVVAARGRIEIRGLRSSVARPLHSAQFHQMFRRDGLGAVHPFFELVSALDLASPERRAEQWLRRWTPGGRRALAIECRIEMKPVDSNRLTLSPARVDVRGDPCGRVEFGYSAEDLELMARARAWLERWLSRFGAAATSQSEIAWARSAGGTCRMGADPRSSVCDSSLRVHATPNLYLCGTATFPRGGALPPELTVAALADRLAEHVIARARWCARAPRKPKRAHLSRGVGTVATPIPLVRRRPQP